MNSAIKITPLVEEMPKVSDFLVKSVSKAGVSPEKLNKMLIVLDEILSNIINYSKADFIEFGCDISSDEIAFTFVDNGILFNPLEIKEADLLAPVEEREFGGLGIFIVKNSVDKMEYEYIDGKNVLKCKILI